MRLVMTDRSRRPLRHAEQLSMAIEKLFVRLMRVPKKAGEAGTLPSDVDPGVLALWLVSGPAAMAIEHRLRLDPPRERRVADKLVPFMFHILAGSRRETSYGR
jgi:hypothetical protein